MFAFVFGFWEGLLVTLVVAGGLIYLARIDTSRATGESGPPWMRGLVIGWMALAVTAPLTLLIALGSQDVPLPVRPPGSRSSCGGGSSSGDLIIVMTAIAILAAIRLGPALVTFFISRRREARSRPTPNSRRLFLAAAVVAGALSLLAGIRLLMGGAQPDAFTTYGALTPPGSKGWRTRAVLARQRSGKGRQLAVGAAIETDGRDPSGHFVISDGAIEVPGLKVWIGDEPMNIVFTGRGMMAQPVRARHPDIDRARRPTFEGLPRYARATGRDKWLLFERRRDGSIFGVVVTVSRRDVDAVGTRRADVGLLLAPPFLPFGIAFVLIALGLFLGLGLARGRRGPIWRVAGAWLLVEAAMILYGTFRIYV